MPPGLLAQCCAKRDDKKNDGDEGQDQELEMPTREPTLAVRRKEIENLSNGRSQSKSQGKSQTNSTATPKEEVTNQM
jgi:hypothetical protein